MTIPMKLTNHHNLARLIDGTRAGGGKVTPLQCHCVIGNDPLDTQALAWLVNQHLAGKATRPSVEEALELAARYRA